MTLDLRSDRPDLDRKLPMPREEPEPVDQRQERIAVGLHRLLAFGPTNSDRPSGPTGCLASLSTRFCWNWGWTTRKTSAWPLLGNRPTTRYLPIAAGNGASLDAEPSSSPRLVLDAEERSPGRSGDTQGAVASACS